jgi:hypothetical protein
MIIERLLEMKEDLVDAAIKLGWKPSIDNLWSMWLSVIGVDEDTTVGLMCIDLLEDKCPTQEAKLTWLIERGFVSTEAEAFVAGINFFKDR